MSYVLVSVLKHEAKLLLLCSPTSMKINHLLVPTLKLKTVYLRIKSHRIE